MSGPGLRTVKVKIEKKDNKYEGTHYFTTSTPLNSLPFTNLSKP